MKQHTTRKGNITHLLHVKSELLESWRETEMR